MHFSLFLSLSLSLSFTFSFLQSTIAVNRRQPASQQVNKQASQLQHDDDTILFLFFCFQQNVLYLFACTHEQVLILLAFRLALLFSSFLLCVCEFCVRVCVCAVALLGFEIDMIYIYKCTGGKRERDTHTRKISQNGDNDEDEKTKKRENRRRRSEWN